MAAKPTEGDTILRAIEQSIVQYSGSDARLAALHVVGSLALAGFRIAKETKFEAVKTQYEQGRLRAIIALRDKPAGILCVDWLRLPKNIPLRTDHPDFIAGYEAIAEITALADL